MSDTRSDQIDPCNVEAEEAVLGAILLRPSVLSEVRGILKAGDFFIIRNGWIYETLCNLREAGQPIDYITVVSDLEKRSLLAEAGGAAYILGLTNKTPSALNVEGYADIVADMAQRRKLIRATEEIARLAHSETTATAELLRKVEGVFKAATQASNRLKVYTSKERAAAFYDQSQEIEELEDGKVLGLQTGWPAYDWVVNNNFTHGVGQGSYTNIVAESGHCKTTLTIDKARYWAEHSGTWVLYIAQETPIRTFAARLACMREGKSFQKYRDKQYPAKVRQQLVSNGLTYLGKLEHLYTVHQRAYMADIAAEADKLAYRYGKPGIVFVDTMNKLMDAERDYKTGKPHDRRNGLANASAMMESELKEKGHAAFGLVQHRIDRSNTRDPYLLIPNEGSTQETNAFMQDPDNLIALFYADKYRQKFDGWTFSACPPSHVYIKNIKGRDGGAGRTDTLFFYAAVPRLEDKTLVSPDTLQAATGA